MCGICGIKGRFATDAVQRMCEAMVHRGPDSEGYYDDENCSLGMRRLKIVDLEGSEQPIFNEDGTLVLIYNGEIYNFKELREDLEKRGHRFQTAGDGETIVHLFETYRQDCVQKLRGMFAFAIWDRIHRQLFLARDRLGIKPLYYAKLPGKLLFASEIKALLASGEIAGVLDEQSIVRYTSYPAVPAPLTIFSNINSLLPGHSLLSDASGTYISEYWDLDPAKTKGLEFTERDASDLLRQELFKAVRIRTISDVPLGAFLSGGIDSSSVVAIMGALSDIPVRTFSIRFTGKGKEFEWFDDASFAQTVAEFFHTEHTEEVITGKEVYDNLLDAVWSMDQPSGDALQYYLVSKAARKGVTVALSGTGGDEVFAGYEWFKEIKKIDSFHRRNHSLIQAFSETGMTMLDYFRKNNSLPPLLRRIESILLGQSSFEARYTLNRRLYRNQEWYNVFSNEFIAKIIDISLDVDPAIHHYAPRCETLDPVSQVSYLQIKTDLPNLLLRDQDAVSMAHSLEVRFPLIDHEIVELVSRFSSSLKLKGHVEKYILRQALKGLLPEEILHRTKKGFVFPMGNWMRNELKPVVESCLSPQSIKRRGIFNHEMTSDMKRKFYEGKEPFFKIWNQVIFELWCRIMIDRKNSWTRPSGRLEDYL